MNESQELVVKQAVETAPAKPKRETTDIVGMLFTNLTNVQDEKKEYIYRPYFPVGKFSIVSADPGTGKSRFADAIAALVTTGKPLMGIECGTPGNVLFFSREDDNIDHKALVRENGGDVDKVFTLSEKPEALEYMQRNPITFASPIVEEAIKHFQPVLVIFDPYQKYVGSGTDTNTANRVSAALSPVITLAKKYSCHIMIIAHNVKAQTGLQYKFMGSVDFIGESRSAMSIVRDPEHPSECIVIHVKSNSRKGKSIRYRIESIVGNEDFAKVKWLALEDYTERDYAEADRSRLTRKVEDATIDDGDYIVTTILRLLEENPSGFKIAKNELQDAVQAYTAQTIDIELRDIIKNYGEYLSRKHNIGLQRKGNTTVPRININGNTVIPSKNKDNCILIRRNPKPDQKMLELEPDI